MDAIDRGLLSLLQEDSRKTAEKLGEELGLSPSATTRRIQKLSGKVIAKEVAVLSDSFRRSRVTGKAERFRRAIRALPEVQLFVEITGASDALILVSVRHMDHFNMFADELAGMPLVRRYETSFIKRTEKFTTAVPLD